jgi:hypothetical protein
MSGDAHGHRFRDVRRPVGSIPGSGGVLIAVGNCDTVALLPLGILHLEPHHVTTDRQEDQDSLVRICRQYDISITTYVVLYNER